MTAMTSKSSPINHLLGVLLRLLFLAISPYAQLAAFGMIGTCAGSTEPAWSIPSVGGWAAGAIAAIALLHLAATRRNGENGMLPTNASAVALSFAQFTSLVILWRQITPGNAFGVMVIAAFCVTTTIDAVQRAAFVLRVRRLGVEGEARRIVGRIKRDHPHDMHRRIADANVGMRHRSRLHWRLGEALSAENVAIYDRERTRNGENA